MNLEQRVQLLEQEVQLLKNQIQTTLLAIQEHVLTNTYPSLRAEEAPSVADTTPKPSGGLRGVNRISFDTAAEPVVEAPAVFVEPAARPAPITPPALAAPHPVMASRPAIDSESIRKPQSTAIDWASLNKMDEWVSQKIDKMGISRTCKLIELYAERGRFSESVKNTLLQLVALYKEEADDYYVPVIDDTMTTFDPPIRAYCAEFDLSKNGQGREVQVHQASSADSNGHHKETGELPQKMILRLIAGLQNAGMDWKKPNG